MDARPIMLKRHANGTMHKLASQAGCNSLPLPTDEDVAVPTREQFETALQASVAGNSCRNGLKGVGGEKKVRKLQWCLAEAKRHQNLEFLLKDARSVSLSCDKRKTRFVLRFRAADQHMNVRAGILYVARSISTPDNPGADSWRKATLQGWHWVGWGGPGAVRRVGEILCGGGSGQGGRQAGKQAGGGQAGRQAGRQAGGQVGGSSADLGWEGWVGLGWAGWFVSWFAGGSG